jgi:hypothetical protein
VSKIEKPFWKRLKLVLSQIYFYVLVTRNLTFVTTPSSASFTKAMFIGGSKFWEAEMTDLPDTGTGKEMNRFLSKLHSFVKIAFWHL